MRSIKGGLVHLIEQWVEHLHQSGSRYDDNWKTLPHKMQALIRSRRESWSGHPRVQQEVQAVDSKFTGKWTKADDNPTKKKKLKEEKRQQAFVKMKVKMEKRRCENDMTERPLASARKKLQHLLRSYELFWSSVAASFRRITFLG